MAWNGLKRKFMEISGFSNADKHGAVIRAKLESGVSSATDVVVDMSKISGPSVDICLNKYSDTLQLPLSDVLSNQTSTRATLRSNCKFTITTQTEFSRILCEDEHVVVENDVSFPEARLKALNKWKDVDLPFESEEKVLFGACVRCFLMTVEDDKCKWNDYSDKLTFETKRIWKREVDYFHSYIPNKEIVVTPTSDDHLLVSIRK